MQPLDGLEQHVVVLTGVQRNVDANRGSKITRPHAAANDDMVRFDITLVRAHATNSATVVQDLIDFSVLKNFRTMLPRTFRQRLCDIDGIGVTIRRNVDATEKIIGSD